MDLIPLMSEDEALVAELVGMEPVAFEHNATTPLSKLFTVFHFRSSLGRQLFVLPCVLFCFLTAGSEETSNTPSQVMENSSSVLNTLPTYMDDPGISTSCVIPYSKLVSFVTKNLSLKLFFP